MTSSVVIAWHGLPAYAARLIKAAGGDFPVIATKPVVPISGMDDILPGRIRWIDEAYKGGWLGLGLTVPALYFQPSWCTPSFNHLGDEVRAAGGRVVVMFDNPWRGDFRQFLGAIRFRTQWSHRFDAVWVAGESGKKLARYWGFKPKNIYTGMYGSDPMVFGSNQSVKPLPERPRSIVFVGRLVNEKGVRELLQSWEIFKLTHSDWTLNVYGTGPLESLIKGPGIVFHGFQQPFIIAEALKSARFLVLPSHLEHWGLVVCEAAQSGCGLLLSETVGSVSDLLSDKNGFCFPPKNVKALVSVFDQMSILTDVELEAMQSVSETLGVRFTPQKWAATFSSIVNNKSAF